MVRGGFLGKNSTNNLVILALKAFVLMTLGVYFPVIYFFVPALFITESLKSGIVKVMAVFLIICCAILYFAGVYSAVSCLLLLGPFILLFNYLIITDRSVDFTIILTAVLFFISMVVVAYFLGITSTTLKSQEMINRFIETQGELIKQMGTNMEVSNSALVAMYNRGLQLIPSVMLLCSLIMSYLTYTFTGRNLLREKKVIKQPSSFIFFRLPSGFLLSGLIGVVLIYLFQDYFGSSYKVILENIIVVYSALLFFQGLSFIKFMLIRARVNRFVQFLIIVAALMFPEFQIVLVILGIADVIVNFRQIPK